jgi:hypothetical protein
LVSMGKTNRVVIGQHVYVDGGFGPLDGTVIKIEPPCIYVETDNWRLRFNNDGKECGPNGKAYTYDFNVMFGPGPWELRLEKTNADKH